MSWSHAARRLSLVAAVTALTGVTATPAVAQADPVTLSVVIADTVVPAGGSKDVGVVIDTNRATTLESLTFSFEVGGLAGVAAFDTSTLSMPCDVSGTLITCTDQFPTEVGEDPVQQLTLELVASPGAVPGDHGTLGVAVSADGVAEVSDSAAVTIAAPVDLVAGGDGVTTATPGDHLSVAWTVQNAGPEPAAGSTLWVGLDAGLQSQVKHNNCVYYGNLFFPSLPGGALCSFDVVLEPGMTYELTGLLGLEVRNDAAAPGFLASVGIWMTHSEAVAFGARLEADRGVGEPGTGPALSLAEAGGGTPDPLPADPPPAADTDPDNNFARFEVTVEGDNQHDFAAVGAEFTGAAGDQVTADLGLANLGPALASTGRSGEPLNFVRITVPEGTTAIQVPDNCSPDGEAAYLCTAGFVLPVGETEPFKFVLRIDEVIPDATGQVEVNFAAGAPTQPTDLNPDNDVATIVVNASADGGTGGGLPVTGSASWLVAAAGGLLLLLAGTGVLLVRRQRVRFVA